jgi:uncharacterized protein (TIGR02996 family)
MLDREPFLKAIFAAPEDDLPRLVFADFLDERGDHAWAELIRLQCEYTRFQWPSETDGAVLGAVTNQFQQLVLRIDGLLATLYPGATVHTSDRGFRRSLDSLSAIAVTVDDLSDPEKFRLTAVSEYPEWYGAPRLKIRGGRIRSPDTLATIFTSPVTERVTELDLRGGIFEIPWDNTGTDIDSFPEFVVKHAITPSMVAALAQTREARRLTELDLRNNDLGNDAARALVASPYLTGLKRLYFTEGNSLRGRIWQQVLERFGADVAH